MLKRALFGSIVLPSTTGDALIALARIAAGAFLAFGHGLGKIPPSEGFIQGVTGLGFPAPTFFAWCASLAEFGGGIGLAIGLFTRPAAFFVGFTMVVANFGAHAADGFDKRELSGLYLAVAVIFLVLGGGRFSIDRLFRKS